MYGVQYYSHPKKGRKRAPMVAWQMLGAPLDQPLPSCEISFPQRHTPMPRSEILSARDLKSTFQPHYPCPEAGGESGNSRSMYEE